MQDENQFSHTCLGVLSNVQVEAQTQCIFLMQLQEDGIFEANAKTLK